MKLIVGLGNPGKRYEKTRHNVGFMIVDALHDKLMSSQISDWSLSKKFNAKISGLTVHNEKMLLAKPMTFMNESGQSVQLISQFYKLILADIVVVHDEKDFPLGEFKIESGRGHAGHNGIKSITNRIGTKDYLRVRAGVGSANEKKMQNAAGFVLSKFSLLERSKLNKMIGNIVDELYTMLKK